MCNNDLIRRTDAIAHPFANGKYDHGNANKDFIKGYESYREWLEDLPAVPQPMSADYFSRLGKAFLARLDIPQGMSEEEAAERIIKGWAQEHPERRKE